MQAEAFDRGVTKFRHAPPRQLYAELARPEPERLIAGREVAIPQARSTARAR